MYCPRDRTTMLTVGKLEKLPLMGLPKKEQKFFEWPKDILRRKRITYMKSRRLKG